MMRMMTDKNTFVLTDDDRRFIKTARKILANEKVQQMKQYVQHGDVSTYEHCLMVCLYAYMYAKRLKLKINIEALVKGALLHDFFLYDWHKGAFTRDGRNTFPLTVKERGIIINHMWPLTLTRLPRSKEAWLVCWADKYCSLKETLLKKPY